MGPKGEPVIDDHFYVIFNAHFEPIEYLLPPQKYGNNWLKVIDSHAGFISDSHEGETFNAESKITVESRSVMVFKQLVER